MKRKITIFFILFFLFVVPTVEAKLYVRNVNEQISVSNTVSVEKNANLHIDHKEDKQMPLSELVLAIIMPAIITIFLLYFKIPSNEIPIWIPIKSPVKHVHRFISELLYFRCKCDFKCKAGITCKIANFSLSF